MSVYNSYWDLVRYKYLTILPVIDSLLLSCLSPSIKILVSSLYHHLKASLLDLNTLLAMINPKDQATNISRYALSSPLMKLERPNHRRRASSVPMVNPLKNNLKISHSYSGESSVYGLNSNDEDFKFLDLYVRRLSLTKSLMISPTEKKVELIAKTKEENRNQKLIQMDYLKLLVPITPCLKPRSESEEDQNSSLKDTISQEVRDSKAAECRAMDEVIASHEEQKKLDESISINITTLKELSAEFDFLNTTDIYSILEEELRLKDVHCAIKSRFCHPTVVEESCIASMDFLYAVSELSNALGIDEQQVLELVKENDRETIVVFSRVHPQAVSKLRRRSDNNMATMAR